MRTLEIVLLLSFAPLLVVSVWRWSAHRLHLYLAALPAVVCPLHLLFEGYRWQLVPAYVLAALALLWAVHKAQQQPDRPGSHPAWRVLGRGLVVLVLGVSAVLAVILPVFELPAPTGPQDVGTVTEHLVDEARGERELMVQVWYPATVEEDGRRAPYTDTPRVFAPMAANLGLPAFTVNHFRLVRSHAYEGAAPVESARAFPVVLLSHGLGGSRAQHTVQAQELASHGFVVVAIDHTDYGSTMLPGGRFVEVDFDTLGFDTEALERYDAAAMEERDDIIEERVLPVWVGDQAFVLDWLERVQVGDEDHPLTGRLDLQRIGTWGHSLGGSAALHFCRDDARCRAVLDMDGPPLGAVAEAGLAQPLMLLSTENHAEWSDEELEGLGVPVPEYRDFMEDYWASLGAVVASHQSDAHWLRLAGSAHMTFSDVPFYLGVSVPSLTGETPPRRGQEIIGTYARAFFETYLREEPSPLLDGETPQYPEVTFGS